MKPIVLALQYWAGDRDRAIALAEHATSARRTKSPNTFIFVSRFDCDPPPKVLLAKMRRKYAHVHSVPGTTKLTGHPDGCWGLWKDTIAWFRAHGSEHSAILTFEADCTPLWPDFDERLQTAWEKLPTSVFMAGHHWTGPAAVWGDHVNGNCMVRYDEPKLDRICALIMPAGKPWDVYFYPVFYELGVSNLPAIRSIYGSNFTPQHLNMLRSSGAAIQHGDKDGSLQSLARKSFGPSEAGFPVLVQNPAAVAPPMGFQWFEYPDEIPSVLSQLPPGSSWAEIKAKPLPDENPGDVYLRYNGSACPNGQSGVAFVYRRQWVPAHTNPEAWRSDLVWLDGVDPHTGECSRPGRVLDLPARYGATLRHLEDPRLVPGPSPDRLRLCYSRASYHPDANRGVDQTSVIVDANGCPTGAPVTLSAGDNALPGTWAKNWGFLPGSEEVVYKLHPCVEIYNPTRSEWKVSDSSESWTHWFPRYGHPRGGTPPIYVPEWGGWLSMMQSHSIHPTRQRRYHAGFLLLASDPKTGNISPKILATSKNAVLTASERDGFAFPVGTYGWEPVVVFPTSLFRIRHDFFVTVGVNDCRMFALRFPMDVVANSLGLTR